MADFTSSFWNWYIIIPTIAGIIACFLLIRWLSSMRADEIGKPTGHVWDEDLQELNNPLPRWWLMMFYITLFFGIGYLALYPGLGSFKGLLGWTSTGQYRARDRPGRCAVTVRCSRNTPGWTWLPLQRIRMHTAWASACS